MLASPLLIVGGLGYGTYKLGALAGKGIKSGVDGVQESIEQSNRAKQVTPDSIMQLVRLYRSTEFRTYPRIPISSPRR